MIYAKDSAGDVLILNAAGVAGEVENTERRGGRKTYITESNTGHNKKPDR